MSPESGELPPGYVRCAHCSQFLPVRSSRCWTCSFPVVQTLSAQASGDFRAGPIAAILAVFVVLLVGLLGIGVRGGLAAPASYDEISVRTTEAVLAGAPRPTPRPTPVPSVGDDQYLVQRGDSLFSVATATGIDAKLLRHWNVEHYPTLASTPALRPGWILQLSGPPLPTPEPRPTRTPRPVAEATPVPTAAAPVPTAAAPGQRPTGSGVALVPLPALTVDVWNAAEHYFAISGRNPTELADSARANVPSNCLEYSGDAIACAGPAVQSVEPTYAFDPATGACTLTGATVSVSYAAYLPQWTSPSAVPPELLEWWKAVLEPIRWHEEQHIRIFADHYGRLPAMLAGQPCDRATTIVEQWQRDARAAQDAFHVVDDAWQPPPYTGPWEW